ncbi:MAG: hypothetical protein KN64_01010 [Sulfurovum sp. AS07-7]|nr:MAG: hypothetical protein KN64_01010 [Sulfurovum sp. AS07-7]
MKKDNLVSVGMILNHNTEISFIEELHKRLTHEYNYFEIILLSFDSSFDAKKLFKKFTNIMMIELSKEVDLEIMHTSLIENCIGDYIAIVDLAHDPIDDLMSMLEKCEDFDVVIGKRTKKFQTFFEKLTSTIFYKIINLFTGIKIDNMYSNFVVMNRKVINFVTKNKDKVKFLKLLTLNNGFSKYDYEYTPKGQKSYSRNLLNNVNFTIDVLVNYSHRLIRLATLMSISMSLFNFLYITYVIGIYLFKTDITPGWTSSSLYSSVSLFTLFLVLAIIGEYVRVILANQNNSQAYEIVSEQNSVALVSNTKNIDQE